MRTHTTPWLTVTLAAVVPALLLTTRATAQSPPDAPSASAGASTSAAAPTRPPLPRLSGKLASLPDKPTPAPTSWKGAEPLALDAGNGDCEIHLVREWLHASCGSGNVIDVSLLSGESSGVSLSMPGEEFNVRGDIVLPLRKGRSYVVSVTAASFGRYSSGLPESAALLWVLWDDAPSPTVRVE
jgi:hypothetical protein